MSDLIQILSDQPETQIWTHLRQWESVSLARQFIEEKADRNGDTLSPDMLDAKAHGIAYSMRNAREYFMFPPDHLSARILNTYYGLMGFVGAILIADTSTTCDLAELEKASRMGHGLHNIDDDGASFPEAQKVFVKQSGFFVKYLKLLGATINDVCIPGRLGSISELQPDKVDRLVSLDSLLARVPEIAEMYARVTGKPPLNVRVWSSDRNSKAYSRRMRKKINAEMAGKPEDGQSPQLTTHWVSFRGAVPLTGEQVREVLRPPLTDIEQEEGPDASRLAWVGKVSLNDGPYWYDNLTTYKTDLCGTSWIKPMLGGASDPISTHFMLQYLLSILVRYRPMLWREVNEGELDKYAALTRHYIETSHRILPQMVLEKVSGMRVEATQPGSIFGPL